MIRLTVHIVSGRLVKAFFIGLLVSLLVYTTFAVPGSSVKSQQSLASVYVPYTSGRHFYLTSGLFATTTAPTACSSGYHMASLWEILNVSNMIYDYKHPAAKTKNDSGYGPPSSWNGWVRTGFDSSGSSTTGSGNCNNWTSASISDYGVSVKLSNAWETLPGDIYTWDATSFSCNYIGLVWCVGDFYAWVFLPAIRKAN